MSEKTKAILVRLLKGFLSGAVTSMIMVSVVAPSNWKEMATIINILAVSGIFGGINGLLLAIQKWLSWKDELTA